MLNKVMIIGHVGADPEVRTLESGVKVCRLRVATSERVKQGEEWKDHTEWHSVTLWRNLADVADKYVRKGSRVYVEGRIRQGKYVDKNNIERSTFEIFCDEFKLLDRREGEQRPGTSSAGSAPHSTDNDLDGAVRAAQRVAASGESIAAKQGKQVYIPDVPDVEEDLPF